MAYNADTTVTAILAEIKKKDHRQAVALREV